MPMIQGAAEVAAAQAAAADHLSPDYSNELCHAILEAYSGIFQGFKSSRVEPLVPYAAHILHFLESIYEDKDR
jgi:importin subunit beta-1